MTIKELRKYTGLSQQAFGDKYNIPMRTIQNWENGQRECPIYLLELLERAVKEDFVKEYMLIADYGDMDVEYFLTSEEAIAQGKYEWGKMSDYDKKRMEGFYILKTVNPDREAENHFDGDIIFDFMNCEEMQKKEPFAGWEVIEQ